MGLKSKVYSNTIEDSQPVIEDYKKIDQKQSGSSYLTLYGLKGLFVQQDAFKILFKLCIDNKFDLLSIRI